MMMFKIIWTLKQRLQMQGVHLKKPGTSQTLGTLPLKDNPLKNLQLPDEQALSGACSDTCGEEGTGKRQGIQPPLSWDTQ